MGATAVLSDTRIACTPPEYNMPLIRDHGKTITNGLGNLQRPLQESGNH